MKQTDSRWKGEQVRSRQLRVLVEVRHWRHFEMPLTMVTQKLLKSLLTSRLLSTLVLMLTLTLPLLESSEMLSQGLRLSSFEAVTLSSRRTCCSSEISASSFSAARLAISCRFCFLRAAFISFSASRG